MSLSKNQKKVIKKHGGDLSKVIKISAGHMSYHHLLFDGQERTYFVKAHDPKLFTDPIHEKKSEVYLKKEVDIYKHLSSNGFKHIPDFAVHDESMLLLKALRSEDGWFWRMPSQLDLQNRYFSEILEVLKKLESAPSFNYDTSMPTALTVLQKEGWDDIASEETPKLVESGLAKWAKVLRPDTLREAYLLRDEIYSVKKPGNFKDISMFNHHDARQANIAWHPKHGTAIVDWSWAGPGVKNGDTTMFLIDMHKRGFNLPAGSQDYFNKDYALYMMGFWLKRSSARPRNNDDTVRYHQFVSAVMAHSLIKKFAK